VNSVFLVETAARAAVNTMVACAGGSLAGLVWSNIFNGSYSLELAVNTMLGSLVAVTGPCGYVEPWAALVVGILSVVSHFPHVIT
jgi:Amt family ammonium transporter